MKTYQRVFEDALRKLNLSKKDVKDWRPASEVHIPDIKGCIIGGVVIWTQDGREIIFREKGSKRFIAVDTTDTIGDLISRLMPGGIIKTTTIDPMFSYCIPQSVWNSPIPEAVLLPDGGDVG